MHTYRNIRVWSGVNLRSLQNDVTPYANFILSFFIILYFYFKFVYLYSRLKEPSACLLNVAYRRLPRVIARTLECDSRQLWFKKQTGLWYCLANSLGS